jgi:peptidyl-tRNA hydrolase, PTH1 family
MIVGLGNPGPQYRYTRHNVGFRAVDCVAEQLDAEFSQEKYGGLVARARCGPEEVWLIKPLTYMNESGSCVARGVRYKNVDLGNLLVVADDVNLPLGKLRFRTEGSAGGHNGLKSIMQHLGTEEFPRLRIGVGQSKPGDVLRDHVLSAFLPEERPDAEAMVARAADAVRCFLTEGMAKAMNAFN